MGYGGKRGRGQLSSCSSVFSPCFSHSILHVAAVIQESLEPAYFLFPLANHAAVVTTATTQHSVTQQACCFVYITKKCTFGLLMMFFVGDGGAGGTAAVGTARGV